MCQSKLGQASSLWEHQILHTLSQKYPFRMYRHKYNISMLIPTHNWTLSYNLQVLYVLTLFIQHLTMIVSQLHRTNILGCRGKKIFQNRSLVYLGRNLIFIPVCLGANNDTFVHSSYMAEWKLKNQYTAHRKKKFKTPTLHTDMACIFLHELTYSSQGPPGGSSDIGP